MLLSLLTAVVGTVAGAGTAVCGLVLSAIGAALSGVVGLLPDSNTALGQAVQFAGLFLDLSVFAVFLSFMGVAAVAALVVQIVKWVINLIAAVIP